MIMVLHRLPVPMMKEVPSPPAGLEAGCDVEEESPKWP
jgi:hypothetical protein